MGKALSDTNTREVIIGVLAMLMVLPLLAPTSMDFSQEYGVIELFQMGRSNCKIPTQDSTILLGKSIDHDLVDTYLCE